MNDFCPVFTQLERIPGLDLEHVIRIHRTVLQPLWYHITWFSGKAAVAWFRKQASKQWSRMLIAEHDEQLNAKIKIPLL